VFVRKENDIAAKTSKQHSKRKAKRLTAKTCDFGDFEEQTAVPPFQIMEFLGFCSNSWMLTLRRWAMARNEEHRAERMKSCSMLTRALFKNRE
jgi:hypothetical protein